MADPRPRPVRVPLHLVYFMLFALGILSGLWLHGHPLLTLFALVAVVPLSMVAYVPRRWLNDEVRQILHYLVASIAVAWGIYRFGQHPPLDVLLIEVFTVLGLSFAFTSHQRGHQLMLMISIVLVFYGSVAPPRSLYVWLVPIALVLALLLLYQSRVASLSGQPETTTLDTVKRWNLPWIIVHAVLVLVLWGALVVVFPTPNWESSGLAPVSFQNRSRSILPPRFQTWFQSPFMTSGRDGEQTMDGTDPTMLDKQAMTKVENVGGEGSFNPESGGSGYPGDELVMRVRSPLKLYWLGQMYDEYDGESWHQSKAFTRQHITWRQLKRHKSRAVNQVFVIEKWITPTLFAAYLRGSRLSPQNHLTHSPNLRENFSGVRLAFPDNPQPVPFAYEVRSFVDFHLRKGEGDQPLEGWYEKLEPEHYLQLPEEVISDRVRNLAKRLVAGQRTELARAYAIRDYLRETYPYELSTRPLPEGREPVDYFLFDLRQGHCEYFAAAMTVLCREVGLPARVCTGYSPGNYNVLTEMFEVYEYHAHAWAQVFIPGMGWLTMDATPEGSLPNRTRTTPPMIGNLRDPFSDEWRIRTPELSRDVRAHMREQASDQQEQNAKATSEAQTDGEGKPGSGLQQALKDFFSGETQAGDGDTTFADSRLEAFTTNVGAFFTRVKQGFQAIVAWLRDALLNWTTLLIAAGLAGLWLLYPRLHATLRSRRRLKRSIRLFTEAGALCQDDPSRSILASYQATRNLLDLAGHPKHEANMDLYEYLRDDIAPDLREPARDLFSLYIKLQYQPDLPVQRDAEQAYRRAIQLRDMLLPRIENPTSSRT